MSDADADPTDPPAKPESDGVKENGGKAENPAPEPSPIPPEAAAKDSPALPPCAEPVDDSRRAFVAKAGSVCAGCALVGIPIAAGVPVVLDPIDRGGTGEADFLHVATLDALPEDGTPQQFTVRADKQDAWSRFPDRAIGAVYLRRMPDGGLQALNVVCPHLGCAIEYRGEQHDYFCKCHDSAFAFEDGARSEGSPSARGLDTLAVEVRNDTEVWVQFQNFVTGIPEKRPV